MNAVKKLFVLTSAAAAMSASGFAAANNPATGEFYVTILIKSTCTVATATGSAPTKDASNPAGADIDFGEYFSNHDSEIQKLSKAGPTNGIAVTCTKNTPYTISLKPSNGNTSGQGEMSGVSESPAATSGDKIAYKLYKDSGYQNAWGSQGGTTVSGEGGGMSTPKYHAVYGKVEGNQFNKTAGRYFDRVAVEVSY